MQPAKRDASHQDLLAVPDHLVAELVAGTLYASPPPASPHAYAASTLGMDIGSPFQRGRGGPGGWWMVPGTAAWTWRSLDRYHRRARA